MKFFQQPWRQRLGALLCIFLLVVTAFWAPPRKANGIILLIIAVVAVSAVAVANAVDCSVDVFWGCGSDGGSGGGCVSSNGNGCTSGANACGDTNDGTIQCGGSCSASAPGNPSGYGNSCQSGANDCGQRSSGNIGCNGCDAGTPANPSWLGQFCSSGTNECGMRNVGSYQCNHNCSVGDPSNTECPSPSISTANSIGNAGGYKIDNTGPYPTIVVTKGTTATLFWSATPATNCTITSNNGFSQSTTGSGSITTTPVIGNTIYTITCWVQGSHGTGPSSSSHVRVIPNPQFKEL